MKSALTLDFDLESHVFYKNATSNFHVTFKKLYCKAGLLWLNFHKFDFFFSKLEEFFSGLTIYYGDSWLELSPDFLCSLKKLYRGFFNIFFVSQSSPMGGGYFGSHIINPFLMVLMKLFCNGILGYGVLTSFLVFWYDFIINWDNMWPSTAKCDTFCKIHFELYLYHFYRQVRLKICPFEVKTSKMYKPIQDRV